MTPHVCDACWQRPTRDTRLLCDQCAWRLGREVNALPVLVDELDTTLTRQARIGGNRGGRRGTRTTDPVDKIAGELGTWEARNPVLQLRDSIGPTLTRIARDVVGGNPPSDPSWLAVTAQLLEQHVDTIARHPDAAAIYAEVTELADQARHAIDRPADRLYAGICGATVESTEEPGDGLARGGVGHWRCTEALYAQPGWEGITCSECGSWYAVTERRQQMLRDLDDRLVTAAEAATLAGYLGELAVDRTRFRNLITQWRRRGRIAPHDTAVDGSPRYKFGEVIALLARHQADTEARRGA